MHLSHHRLLPTESLRHREHGFVLVTFALLLVPLLLMVGFAVDVGSWYNRASDMQKAADAAALAGVVWLPDVGKATAYANEAAARNGFNSGVTVTRAAERQLQVTIEDPAVGSFFYGGITGKTIDLTRTGTAEYVLPVPLGSPDYHFGNDPNDNTYTQPNLWGNIHGENTDAQKGDAYATKCFKAEAPDCALANPGYRPSGYLYTIDVPAGMQGMDVQIYDAGLAPRSAENIDTGDTHYSGTNLTTTTWTMYDADATVLDVNDNPTAASDGLCSTGAGTWVLKENGPDQATYKNQWQSLCKRSGNVPEGRYLLRVQTSGASAGANRYAIKVLSTGSVKPRIAGYGDMSMYNNISTGSSTTDVAASFYLAEVDPVHAGKTFRVSMYDPGEVSKTANTLGNGTIQVLAPNGSVAQNCMASSASPSAPFTSGSILSSCSFKSAENGNANFNGYWVTLDVPIPNTYSCTLGTTGPASCWWKIKYIINGQANDTTTWAAQIIGDPVHLIEQ
jgi:hypothetical protein